MRKLVPTVAAAALFLVASAAHATPIAINFDEFTSPPVTCCYSDTGVHAPLVYPDVTISDLPGGEGAVMNNTGWADMQTSGENLFGTVGGEIDFTFTSGVSNVFLDIINGTSAAPFTLNLFDSLHALLYTESHDLADFGTPGSVLRFGSAVGGVSFGQILGNDDIAIDTINFDTGAAPTVPEPASLLLLGTGILGLARRYRRRA